MPFSFVYDYQNDTRQQLVCPLAPLALLLMSLCDRHSAFELDFDAFVVDYDPVDQLFHCGSVHRVSCEAADALDQHLPPRSLSKTFCEEY